MSKLTPIPQSEWHQSQRGFFAASLYNLMIRDERIRLVTADLGYKVFDRIKEDFPDRYINVGASEQAGAGICVGLALEGLVPFFYSITPFLLWRPAETIRNYINREEIPVKLIGSGRNQDYHVDGFSHYAGDDKDILRCWDNIQAFWPEEKEHIPELLDETIKSNLPTYINLTR